MKFNVVISDAGHRPSSGYPCYFAKNIIIHYIFQNGGIIMAKKDSLIQNLLFKFLGKYECKAEIKNKIKADIVVVLSELTKKSYILRYRP